MSLSLAQAQQAGVLADQINSLQDAVVKMQGALNAGAAAIEFAASVVINGQQQDLRGRIPMNASDTATVFNAVIAVYQNDLTALNAQLAAIG